MKRQILILTFFITSLFSYSQTNASQDSATIIIKNVSSQKFYEYRAAIKGQIIEGRNLKSGQSNKFKVAVNENNIFRFTIYLDKKHQKKYSIEPIDYFSQVSEMKINSGRYEYLIDIDKKDDSLSIKLTKAE